MNIICQIEYCLSFFLLSEFSSVNCISAQSDKSCTLDILYKTINSLGNSHPGIAFIVGCERFCPNTLLFQLELSRYWITAILHSCFLVSGPLITLSSLFCMCTNKSSNRIKRFLAQNISMKWWGCSYTSGLFPGWKFHEFPTADINEYTNSSYISMWKTVCGLQQLCTNHPCGWWDQDG